MTLFGQLNAFRVKWQLSVVSVAFVALVVVVFWMDQANDDARFRDAERVNRALRVAEIDRAFGSCNDARDFRETFAEFLDQSARPSSGGVDYSRLSSFAELDPATQRFLDELAALQSTGANTVAAIAAEYRERFFPLPDCRRIRADAMRRLPG